MSIFRMFYRAALLLLFYPAMIALMIWLWWTGQHWIWGICVIAAVLILDPIYRVFARGLIQLLQGKSR